MVPNGDVIQAVLAEAAADEEKLNKLLLHPDVVLSEVGIAVPPNSEEELKAFLKEALSPSSLPERTLENDTTTMSASMVAAAAWPSARCTTCTISVWAIAAGIVATGATALAALTTASSIVTALASWASVSPAAALAFIKSIAASIASGVAAVANKICTWAGYCP